MSRAARAAERPTRARGGSRSALCSDRATGLLVKQAGAGLSKAKKSPRSGKVLDNAMLADVFGIEMDATIVPAKQVSPQKKAPAAKTSVKKSAKITKKKTVTTRKTASVKKAVAVQPSAKDSSKLRKATTSLTPEGE